MSENVDWKCVSVFVLFAFAVAWATGLVIYLTGGLVDSPKVAGGITLAVVLLATAYMGAPALAHILTRLVTREGWKNVYLRPKIKRGWPYWLVMWFAPGILVFVGIAVFFLLFPQYFDPSLSVVEHLLTSRGVPSGMVNPWTIVISQTLVALALAPVLNSIATLGEEFGWRAYLLPKLLPLGGRAAVVLTGIVWGVWHWPVIVMGYEYGFKYAGFPWSGMLLFILFTVFFGTLSGWAFIKSGSVWPSVIGHGAVNGIAGVAVFFVKGTPNPLLGPAAVGIIGMIGFAVVAVVLLLLPGALEPQQETPTSSATEESRPANAPAA